MLLHALIPASRANGPGLALWRFSRVAKSVVLAVGTLELIRFMVRTSMFMP